MNTCQENFQLDLQVVFNAIELAAMARHERATPTTTSTDESDDDVGDEGEDGGDEDEDTSEDEGSREGKKRTRLKITLRVSPRHMRSFDVLNLRRFLHKLFCITFSKRG